MKSITIALVLICPITSFGQYAKVPKGTPCPFDTCVSIKLSEYRKVRSKVIAADTLVQGLTLELLKVNSQLRKKDSVNTATNSIIEVKENLINSSAELCRALQQDNQTLTDQLNAPIPWYKQNKTGFVLGVLISSLLFALVK